MDTQQRLAALSAELYASLDTRTRANGEEFVCTKDNVPMWCQEAIREAHRGVIDFGPEDMRYSMIRDMASKLSDYEPSQWDDSSSEMVDGSVDIYNWDLLKWVSSHLSRYCYVEESCGEFGIPMDGNNKPDFIKMLTYGQVHEYNEIYASLVHAIRERCEEIEQELVDDGQEDQLHQDDSPLRGIEITVAKVRAKAKSAPVKKTKTKKGKKPKGP